MMQYNRIGLSVPERVEVIKQTDWMLWCLVFALVFSLVWL